MDRRKFTKTVAVGYLTTPFLALARGPTIVTNDVAINFVGKVRGANLTTKPGHPLQSAMWVEWDWNGWIRPQVDCAVALGCNAVRLIGDVAMVVNGNMTQAAYNARLQQFVAYCMSQRLAVYYTGCATYDTNGNDNGNIAAYEANPQAFADVIKSNIAVITSRSTDYTPSILACDLVQEANGWANSGAINNLYLLIRPFVPSVVPCTFSISDRVQNMSWIASVIGACDFLDYHIHPQTYGIDNQPSAEALVNGPRAAYPNKEIIFGEGGANSTVYDPAKVSAWLTGLAALGNMDDPYIRGSLMWAVQDQDEQYGAFDANWNPRGWVAGPWIRNCRLPYLSIPIAAAPSASPDRTKAPPARSITDASGRLWTLGAPAPYGKQILLNGASASGGQGTLIEWIGGQVKIMNSRGNWYLWTGSTWVGTDAP